MNYHRKIVDEDTGIKALQNIKGTIRANHKVKKYYNQMQEIAQEQKQEVSKDLHETLLLGRKASPSTDYPSLQSQFQDYIDNPPDILPHTDIIPLVRKLRKQIREVCEKSDNYLQNSQNDNKRREFNDHIIDINARYREIREKFHLCNCEPHDSCSRFFHVLLK